MANWSSYGARCGPRNRRAEFQCLTLRHIWDFEGEAKRVQVLYYHLAALRDSNFDVPIQSYRENSLLDGT